MQCGPFSVECGLGLALGFHPHLAQRLKQHFLALGRRGLLQGEMYRIYRLFFLNVCGIDLSKNYIFWKKGSHKN
jgi:hypothetical protein